MVIRRTTGPTQTTTPTATADLQAADAQQTAKKVQESLDGLKAALSGALDGGGSKARLSETEARALLAQAEAGGPEVVKGFKLEIASALHARLVDDKPLLMSADTENLLADFSGVQAGEIKLDRPLDLSDDVRTTLGREAAAKLIGVVKEHKDVAGTGQEAAAAGDPRVTERRSALSTLVANRAGGVGYLAALKALGPNVENDIKWLMAADRSEYNLDGNQEQFSWAKSNMSGARKISAEFKRRTTEQKKQAEGIDNGTRKSFDVSSGSVVGLSMIKDVDKRADSLVDTLLQFRARTDLAEQKEVRYSASGGTTRADEIGPVLIAEQRILLAAADLDTTEPNKVREYALLREIIASHPTSSVNGIFEARNAVGKIFMDGAASYSGKDHATAWIKEEIPPTGSASAYSSIHHNFSRDTPKNVEAVFTQWVFPHGEMKRRIPVFLALVDAQERAGTGDLQGAKSSLKNQLSTADKATVADLLTKLEGASDKDWASTIRTFLLEKSEKPLATDARATLKSLAVKAQSNSTWELSNALKALNPELKEAFKPLLDQMNDLALPEKTQRLEKFLAARVATGSLPDDEKAAIENLLAKAKSNSVHGLKTALSSLTPDLRTTLEPLLKGERIEDLNPKEKGALIEKYLEDNKDKSFPDANVATNLDYFARLYRSVCADQPSAATLEQDLFKSGPAWKEVADVIAQLRSGNDLATLKDLGQARLAMRDAIVGSDKGFERHEMVKFDADLSRLTNTELGAAVDRVGSLKTDHQKAEALLGVETALRSAVASGLHELKDSADPASSKGEPLHEVLAAVTTALESGKITEDGYRALMSQVYVSVARTVQNIRAFVDARAPNVAEAGAELDPEFLDQFVKQSPLHYATALAEKGMRAGLKEEIGPRMIKNVEGMRILNSVGPVVFESVYFAENTKELVGLKPEKDAMSVLFTLEEKKMVAVGGLIVDTEHAPGGNSHLNMYAMNNGITVLALPELRTKYAALFESAKSEGGLYCDDTGGEFRMMTVDYAIEQGIIKPADLKDLAPGFNRKISYLKSKGLGEGFEKVGYHEALVSPGRKTREIELFIAMDEVGGVGRKCTSFEDLAKLGIHARHLAGEKGTVLALLRSNPKLRDAVPDGSMVTTGRCRALLEEANILDEWESIWKADPTVGVVDDDNFLKSKFYTDPDYRADKREWLQALTKSKLTDHLLINKDQSGRPADVSEKDIKHMDNELARLDGAWPYAEAAQNPDGKSVKGDAAFQTSIEAQFGKSVDEMRSLVEKFAPKLTDAGRAIYDELSENPALSGSDNWIARSSFTGEDRPGKSGAGQYESFYHLKDPVSRVDGIIGVMESTWMPEPVENNIADEVNLQHIMPAVVMMHCLEPTESGVMISRDIEHGTRGQVYFQLVKGFGGGVEGGKTEEGTITASGHRIAIKHPDAPDGLVSAADLKELRTIVLETERYFNEVVEKDQGFAVDMEVARVDDKWMVVQARVIQLDR